MLVTTTVDEAWAMLESKFQRDPLTADFIGTYHPRQGSAVFTAATGEEATYWTSSIEENRNEFAVLSENEELGDVRFIEDKKPMSVVIRHWGGHFFYLEEHPSRDRVYGPFHFNPV